MGWLVLKVNPDPAEDRWCLWSTIAEGPVFDGTEKEMIRSIRRQYGESGSRKVPEMIERAKVHGAGTDWDGDWGEGKTLIMNSLRGSLPRNKLGDLLDCYQNDASEDEVKALIIPFED